MFINSTSNSCLNFVHLISNNLVNPILLAHVYSLFPCFIQKMIFYNFFSYEHAFGFNRGLILAPISCWLNEFISPIDFFVIKNEDCYLLKIMSIELNVRFRCSFCLFLLTRFLLLTLLVLMLMVLLLSLVIELLFHHIPS